MNISSVVYKIRLISIIIMSFIYYGFIIQCVHDVIIINTPSANVLVFSSHLREADLSFAVMAFIGAVISMKLKIYLSVWFFLANSALMLSISFIIGAGNTYIPLYVIVIFLVVLLLNVVLWNIAVKKIYNTIKPKKS